MGNYKKIIDNLRDEPNYQNLMIVEAADAIEAQAARIAALEAENKKLRTELDWAKYCYDDLRAARAAYLGEKE